MIPVDMSGHGAGTRNSRVTAFKINIPPAADRPSDLEDRATTPQRNRQILARMPMFGGTNLIDRLKPAATVLGLIGS